MGWASAVKNPTRRAKAPARTFAPPTQEIALAKVDWDRLVTLDFETFYDDAYTLSKLSTSEYIRDPRFKAQMVGIKIGNKPTKTYHTAASITLALRSINWDTHAVLAHNCQFDSFILGHHYGIVPHRYYDTLSMARGLHSNEIGAGLHEVSIFYGGEGKIEGGLEPTKGVVNWPAQLIKATSKYCANDVEECYRIFREMAKIYPADEMELIHMTMRMFCAPVLRVDIPRVKAEHAREVAHRQKTLVESIPNIEQYDTWDRSGPKPKYLGVLDKKSGRDDLTGDERIAAVAKKVMGSNERFVNVLVEAGVPKDKIPMKLSDAWMKLRGEEREKQIDKKWTYAFAKTDLNFIDLPDAVWEMHPDWSPENPRDVMRASLLEDRLTRLVAGRLATKSTTNITRAARFIEAGRDGMKLPVGYGYARAHTLRWGGNNKMNMQNLVRGGELRLSILADEGHVLVVCDSGQIEARVNGWLWDQDDLLDAFRASDAYNLRVEGMEKKDRPLPEEHEKDAYCRYASDVYSRPINVNDKDERQLGKICIAEGELVLTPRGPVPIERVALTDLLWDGVEWVSHCGVVDQGIREVITYDGLAATPDHEVFTTDGRILQIGRAASEMARLQVTGIEGRSLRFCDRAVVADTPRKRLSVRQGEMRPDWYYEADVPGQLAAREDDLVSEEWAASDAACASLGAQVRRDYEPLPEFCGPGLGELRGAGHTLDVRQPDGLHPMGVDESPTPGLSRCGDRPSGQRRPLRARESAPGDQSPAGAEPTEHSPGGMAWAGGALGRVPEPAQPRSDRATGPSGPVGGADRGVRTAECGSAPQELALNRRQARVYDIVNAGPRRRFTVSGRLVLNCVLGLGFKMGAQKLQMTLARGAMGAPRMNFPLADVQKMVGIYRSRNHRIVAGWAICKGIIGDMAMGVEGTHKCITWGGDGDGNGWIRLPNGLHLKYPDLKQGVNEEHGFPEWTYQAGEIRKKLYDGLLCLAGDTEVLTDSGWKRIDHVSLIDRVWDGDQWVTHDGVALQGTKQVIDFGGVWMTPDHRVSVDGVWHEAQHTTHAQAASSFARHHRMPEWLSDGGGASWERRPLHAVAPSLRLRAAQDYVGNGVSQGEDDVMRVPDKAVPPRRQNLPRDVQTPRVRGVAEHARPLSKSAAPSLQKLRRAWDRGLPSMAGLRDVLGGYAQRLSAWVDARARKQRAGLHPEQLCMGDLQEPEQQSPKLGAVRDPVGCADHRRSHGCQWSEPRHTLLSPPTEMATRPDAVPVYDILNAGPNRRFTIRGSDGLPFVVHNCENLVQALARIVVASQMLMVEKKYPIVMTTHDEGVAHVKKRDGAKAFAFMRKCFTTPLWWCPDIPLWAEGGYDDNYSK